MSVLESLLYGVIQGLTEFLPISSSGHLALLPHFISIKDPGVLFDLFMHLGTGFAIMFYFKKDVVSLVKGGIKTIFTKEKDPWFLNFTIATVISVVGILALKQIPATIFRTPLSIAICLIVFGVILFIADKFSKTEDDVSLLKSFDFKRSFIIGAAQCLAIFPGVSRSGITITAGRATSLTRMQASKFSFLLSLPIIFGGILEGVIFEEVSFDFINPLSIFIGVFTSFAIGVMTIHFFLKFIARIDFLWFMIYRIILGIGLIISFS